MNEKRMEITDENGQVKVIAAIKVALPNEICTETYLAIGAFDTDVEANNLYCYIKTRFVRFLLLQGLTSMNITKERFLFVPLQDFTTNGDIDWSQSIADIDRQLYTKYNLSTDEIAFIERMIKPME